MILEYYTDYQADTLEFIKYRRDTYIGITDLQDIKIL